jgi:hypothetical protein
VAKPLVKLDASFVPYRLDASTTVKFGFDVSTHTGALPPPLTKVDLRLPAGLNENASQLGLDVCHPAALAKLGPRGCPANSQVGFGSSTSEAAFGGDRVRQRSHMSMFVGPAESAAELLFYNEGRAPIASHVIYFGRSRRESGGPFGGVLETTIPLIPTIPGGSYLVTTGFESTLGPLGLTYYRKSHGRRAAFHPAGIFLPKRCPPNGFRFAVQLRFEDGTEAADASTVPCPRRRGG